jgi:hypothetical protein
MGFLYDRFPWAHAHGYFLSLLRSYPLPATFLKNRTSVEAGFNTTMPFCSLLRSYPLPATFLKNRTSVEAGFNTTMPFCFVPQRFGLQRFYTTVHGATWKALFAIHLSR